MFAPTVPTKRLCRPASIGPASIFIALCLGFGVGSSLACDLGDEEGASDEDAEDDETFGPGAESGETSASGGTDSAGATDGATGGVCEFVGSGSGPDCDACIADSCCDEISSCDADPDCTCMKDCFAAAEDAPNPALCFEQCGLSDFPMPFYPIFTCRNEVCSGVCDTGSDSATSGEMPSDTDSGSDDDATSGAGG